MLNFQSLLETQLPPIPGNLGHVQSPRRKQLLHYRYILLLIARNPKNDSISRLGSRYSDHFNWDLKVMSDLSPVEVTAGQLRVSLIYSVLVDT